METRLERTLDKSMRTPLTTGVIVMDQYDLCVGYRGELIEKDAISIANLIARVTDNAEEYKGQVEYKQKRLQFHKTPEYTFALLRSHTPPPAPSPPATLTPGLTPLSGQSTRGGLAVSPRPSSVGSHESAGTVRGRIPKVQSGQTVGT